MRIGWLLPQSVVDRRAFIAGSLGLGLGLGLSPGAAAAMTRQHPAAVVTLVDPFTTARRQRIVDFAAAQRLVAVYEVRQFVETGGLMSYGPNLVALQQRVALFIDKILKGAKPADLPVEQPTKFELVINLKTAKTLGLTIPQSVLLRADQVIE